jgi:hypothetical protein
MPTATTIRPPGPTTFRRFLRAFLVLIFAVIAPSPAGAADPPPKPAAVTDPTAPLTVHVISGSKEYQSEASLKPFLADLEKHYRVTVTASWGSDPGDPK